jgi:predicted GNAT superfamily acetyltransferase
MANVSIGTLEVASQLREVVALFDRTWAGMSHMPVTLVTALAHSGNYVGGAIAAGQLVGALVGFLGMFDERLALHSHMLAVTPDAQGRNVGLALKQHQRAWSLARNVDTITWTFDPLVGRNAYLNLNRLGAEVAEYLVDFYGEMVDTVNAGDETDRLLAVWRLAGDRALAASGRAEGVERPVNDAVAILAPGPRGEPVTRQSSERVLLCTVPWDVTSLKRDNPELASAWRLALRRMLSGALHDGYTVSDFTKSGSYVLSRA